MHLSSRFEIRGRIQGRKIKREFKEGKHRKRSRKEEREEEFKEGRQRENSRKEDKGRIQGRNKKGEREDESKKEKKERVRGRNMSQGISEQYGNKVISL